MKRYCTYCGSLMTKKLTPSGEYDEYTGKQQFKMHFTCPKKTFWNLRHLDIHVTIPTDKKYDTQD